MIAQGEALRTALGKHRPVWIAASTHQGEDEIVLAAHQEILKQHPNALLILVPRHPERFAAVHKLAASLFSVQTRSSQQTITSDTQVYLGDTMGEMLVLLGASDVCFMGGSLVAKKSAGIICLNLLHWQNPSLQALAFTTLPISPTHSSMHMPV